MSKASEIANQYVRSYTEPHSPSAAQRRKIVREDPNFKPTVEQDLRLSAAKQLKNATHGASRGCEGETSQPQRGERRELSQKSASWFFRAVLLGLMTSAVLLCATLPARAQSPNAQFPPGDAKEKAESACLTCHEARIVVQQRLSKAAWIKELDKMTKWGAEVDPKDHDALVDYFSANFGPDTPVYAAPKSQIESKMKSKH